MKNLTEKQFVRLHKRIHYWRELPLFSSNTNPFFHNDISIVRTPEFEKYYKHQLMKLIIDDWKIKRIDEFIKKFNLVWASSDFLIMAENFYKIKASAKEISF